jgi:hypothetical protein
MKRSLEIVFFGVPQFDVNLTIFQVCNAILHMYMHVYIYLDFLVHVYTAT